jgi:large subunit ribosomal protein L9
MKVILRENVVKLGKAGDLVEAAPGYFRNFLEPRKLAVHATPGALKKRDEEAEILRKKAEKLHEADIALIEKIKALGGIKISAKAGEEGKLYGKVTNKEIAEVLEKQLKESIDKRLIKTNQDITALGTHTATIKLSPDAHTEFNVTVAAE